MAKQENPAPVQLPARKRPRLSVAITAAILLTAAGSGAIVFMKLRGVSADPRIETKVKSMMNLEPFLVNLADADANRFVKVTFRLGLNEPGLGEEYQKDAVTLAATRDRILSLLSTKTADEILTPEGKDRLRKEITEKVGPLFPEGRIVEVFILDFVVQL